MVKKRKGKNHHHHKHVSGKKSPQGGDRGRIRACCGYPCLAASSVARAFGRCLFVTCYPVIQCFGWDERRHHHHHRHFY
ncbi:hypothetical protein ACJRO7_029181 [Eucalyptus globulus]|uniref:Uncharacterized protein n=1 Tax=Eucalyptus globulus TaxID=34317 RepID=A0ABD3JX40_EUCGL